MSATFPNKGCHSPFRRHLSKELNPLGVCTLHQQEDSAVLGAPHSEPVEVPPPSSRSGAGAGRGPDTLDCRIRSGFSGGGQLEEPVGSNKINPQRATASRHQPQLWPSGGAGRFGPGFRAVRGPPPGRRGRGGWGRGAAAEEGGQESDALWHRGQERRVGPPRRPSHGGPG